MSASCGHEPNRIVEYKPLLDNAIKIASHQVERCIIYQREALNVELIPDQDIDWNEVVKDVSLTDPVKVQANDPLYILYTSGTTGKPKGVVRDNGGHAVSLKWSMKNIYNVEPGDVYWAASDIGWVVGHSYIVYAPLLHGCTTILFEGKPVGTPDAGTFWRIISEYKVKVLFTAPTALRAVKRDDPNGKFIKKFDLTSLQSLFLAGERADPDTVLWLERKLKVPIIDHWWQTETGWPVAANPLGIESLTIKTGSPTLAMPGYDVRVLSEDGNEVPKGTLGAISIKLPLPPGSLPSLWNADDRFIEAYLSTFEGFYETGDAGYQDEDGYFYIMSRSDDVINTHDADQSRIVDLNVLDLTIVWLIVLISVQTWLKFAVSKSNSSQGFLRVESDVREDLLSDLVVEALNLTSLIHVLGALLKDELGGSLDHKTLVVGFLCWCSFGSFRDARLASVLDNGRHSLSAGGEWEADDILVLISGLVTLLKFMHVDATSLEKVNHAFISSSVLIGDIASDGGLKHIPVDLSEDFKGLNWQHLLSLLILISVQFDVLADPDASDLHLVERERASLIRADVGCASHDLASSQLLDVVLILEHLALRVSQRNHNSEG